MITPYYNSSVTENEPAALFFCIEAFTFSLSLLTPHPDFMRAGSFGGDV
jgi:hypothetical protein